MIVTLIKKDQIFTLNLPQRVKGQFGIKDMIEDHPRELLSIEAKDGIWYVVANSKVLLANSSGEQIEKAPLMSNSFFFIHIVADNKEAILFVEKDSLEQKKFEKYFVKISKGVNITIGRNNDCDICYNNRYITGVHATLMYYEGQWSLTDNKSKNGTFVNSIGITNKKLLPGDMVYIMGLRIIIGKDFISLNNPDNAVRVRSASLEKAVIKPYQTPEETKMIEKKEKEYYYRSPRFKKEIQKATFTIDNPPANENKDETPLMMVLGPSVTMGMASVTTGGFSVVNAMANNDIMGAVPTIVMSASMLLGTIMWPVITKTYEKRRKRKKEELRQEKYKQYLIDTRKKINDECSNQEKILNENYADIETNKNKILNRSTSLWEKSIGQNDFLHVRLGTGSAKLSAEIKYQEEHFTIEDDNLRDLMYELCYEPKNLQNVPIVLKLYEQYLSSVVGEHALRINFAKGLMLQLMSQHGYDEVKFVLLYDKTDEEKLEFAKWLPHCWSNDHTFRFLASTNNEWKEVSSYLSNEIENRSLLDEQKMKEKTPYYVIFVFSHEIAIRSEMLKQIYGQKKSLHMSVINFVDEFSQVPKECSTVIRLAGTEGVLFDKEDTSGNAIPFKNDITIVDNMMSISRELANIELDLSETSYQLPKMITFLDMLGVGKIEHLNVLNRWRENDPTKSLQVPVGVNTFGDLFYLDLHEKFHGPHGLVAGMTGSGKSEFIMTFILSLAVNYHPNEVAFILIDYKGGGMAKSFEHLPHVAGIITNLDGSAINRSLLSIQSELKHRQAVFAKASKLLGVSNIDIYQYQKAFRDGLVNEPLPHLFVVADEFAELKTQQPEFMTQLVSAARIGRSLGVHLILATQKPSGVVDDQIWSNSKFRVCLKVQDRADSNDMLKRADAAELKDTGRFYLQVGYNELFELGQSAWAGASYYPSDGVSKENDKEIVVIDKNGHPVTKVKIENKVKALENARKQLDVITEYLQKTAEEEHIKVKKLWLEPMEPILLLNDIKDRYQVKETEDVILCPVVGEYDDPVNQARYEMYLPLSKEGNVVLYGYTGSGKTTFLTTMLYDLLCTHTTQSLNVYIMDFGAETLKMFTKAPQVGDFITILESEKVINLLKMLRKEINVRKKLFSDYGGDFISYHKNTDKKVPNILVIINNFAAFTEMYEDYEVEIAYLTREGVRYGIYFILTATSGNGVRYRLLQNFKQILTLQLNDTNDYAGIMGNVNGVYPAKYKGRGIVKYDEVYEFQTAHVAQPEFVAEDVRNLCQALQEINEWGNAKRVPILPDRVDKEFLSENEFTIENVPVGVNKATLNVSEINLGETYISFVTGLNENANAIFAQGLAEIIAEHTKHKVIVMDPAKLYIEDNQAKYQYVKEEFESHIVEMFQLLVARHKSYKADKNAADNFEHIVYIMPSMSEVYKELSPDGADKLNVLLEKGEDQYGVSVIVVDTLDRLQKYASQKWYQKHFKGNGLWIGHGVIDQWTLNITKKGPELYGEMQNDFGVLIQKGKYQVVKLLQSCNKDEEEEEVL